MTDARILIGSPASVLQRWATLPVRVPLDFLSMIFEDLEVLASTDDDGRSESCSDATRVDVGIIQ